MSLVTAARPHRILLALGLLVFAALALPSSTEATSLNEVKKLTASDAQAFDGFGVNVAVSGDTAVVGAYHEDGERTITAAAYVYQRNEGGADYWGEVKKLTASDADDFDRFGMKVAVSGDTAIAGAYGEDAGGSSAGAAYVFQRNEGGADNWGEVKKLVASDAQTEDFFGISVAVSGDTAVIGAYGEDAGGTNAGAAYVFQRDQGGADNWGEVKKLTASDAQFSDLYGLSVAVSGDTAVVGAYFEDTEASLAGAAYVFQRDEGGTDNWGEVRKLTASDAQALDGFGFSVAVSGDTTVVGAWGEDAGGSDAGAAYVFQRNEGGADNWGEVKKLTASDAQASDGFGSMVVISGDTAVVSALKETAYIFQRDQGGADNWGEVTNVLASDPQTGDHFGISVAVSAVTAVVGATGDDAGAINAGAAYVFDLLLPKPTPTPCPPAGCPTPTPTQTPADTPTPTPTATPGGPEMLLTIKAGDCDDPSRPTVCDVPAGAKFQLSVDALAVPVTGYTGMQTYIDFGSDLVYEFDALSAAEETVWPDCDLALKGHPVVILNDQGTPVLDPITINPHVHVSSEVISIGCLSGLIPPHPVSFYTGNLVELSLTCSNANTTTEVILRSLGDSLTPGSTGSAFVFLDPVTINPIFAIPKVSNLTINCVEPPPPVGGVSISGELAALPLESTGASGGSYGVVTLSIAIAAAVVLLAGIGWHASHRRLR